MQGLADRVKRRTFFQYVRAQNADIVMVQETHCVQTSQKTWQNEARMKIVFSHGESNAQGIMVMFKKDLNIQKIENQEIIKGRVQNVCFIYQDHSYSVMNIYAPNTDDPEFFNNVFQGIEEKDKDVIVVGGDLNTTLSKLDYFSATGREHKLS